MRILYFFVVKIAEWLLPLIAFFSKNNKLKAFVKGRKNQFDTLKLVQHPNRYWFHCASLGEFEQARPVIEKLKASQQDTRIVISFFSPSGFEQRKNYELAEAVVYLPLDTPSNALQFINHIQPKVAIFVKYEIWYFYLKALFRKNIPVYLISANFRPDQNIFSIWGQWLFNLLPQYAQIFLQTRNAFDLLKSKGLTNITFSGDTRFDRVIQNAENVKPNEIIESFKANDSLLILGSSWPKEEEILLNYLSSAKREDRKFKIIIAPHDIGNSHISAIMNQFKKWQPQLYSESRTPEQSHLMVLNTIGHLASVYHYADVAFIGGGFTGQLHNILEPLSFGVPVICGPVHPKFPEADMAKKEGVLFEAEDAVSFDEILNLMKDPQLKNKATAFVREYSGASEIVVKSITGPKL